MIVITCFITDFQPNFLHRKIFQAAKNEHSFPSEGNFELFFSLITIDRLFFLSSFDRLCRTTQSVPSSRKLGITKKYYFPPLDG